MKTTSILPQFNETSDPVRISPKNLTPQNIKSVTQMAENYFMEFMQMARERSADIKDIQAVAASGIMLQAINGAYNSELKRRADERQNFIFEQQYHKKISIREIDAKAFDNTI